MIRNIPHPDLPGARRLTPMEMNNLHFRPKTVSTLADKPAAAGDVRPTKPVSGSR